MCALHDDNVADDIMKDPFRVLNARVYSLPPFSRYQIWCNSGSAERVHSLASKIRLREQGMYTIDVTVRWAYLQSSIISS